MKTERGEEQGSRKRDSVVKQIKLVMKTEVSSAVTRSWQHFSYLIIVLVFLSEAKF